MFAMLMDNICQPHNPNSFSYCYLDRGEVSANTIDNNIISADRIWLTQLHLEQPFKNIKYGLMCFYFKISRYYMRLFKI